MMGRGNLETISGVCGICARRKRGREVLKTRAKIQSTSGCSLKQILPNTPCNSPSRSTEHPSHQLSCSNAGCWVWCLMLLPLSDSEYGSWLCVLYFSSSSQFTAAGQYSDIRNQPRETNMQMHMFVSLKKII